MQSAVYAAERADIFSVIPVSLLTSLITRLLLEYYVITVARMIVLYCDKYKVNSARRERKRERDGDRETSV